MPFCFHVRLHEGRPVFCSLQSWNDKNFCDSFEGDEIIDISAIISALNSCVYFQNPIQAAKKAIHEMAEKRYQHDDLKWNHVALLPQFDGYWSFRPILLDLTRLSETSKTPDELVKMGIEILEKEINLKSTQGRWLENV